MAWQTSRTWAGGSTRAWRTKRARALQRDNNTCTMQGNNCTNRATEVDHIINKAQGGTDDLANLRAVCAPCHKALTQKQSQVARSNHPELHPSEPHPGLRR